MIDIKKVSVVVAINNYDVAENNLLSSDVVRESIVQIVKSEGFSSASTAYNQGIIRATGELLVFAHQDVYLPANWYQDIITAIKMLECSSPNWAVLGVVGVDTFGIVRGSSWSNGLCREVGIPIKDPVPAVSLDELVLVVRTSSGLRFDDNLPGWHLYGTDIVQQALNQGKGAHIIHAPVIHNSLPVFQFDKGFARSYSYLRNKWKDRLPIRTCCTTITRFGWPFIKRNIRQIFTNKKKAPYSRLPDPERKAKELGYE